MVAFIYKSSNSDRWMSLKGVGSWHKEVQTNTIVPVIGQIFKYLMDLRVVVKGRGTVQEQNPQGAGVPVRKSKSRGEEKKNKETWF